MVRTLQGRWRLLLAISVAVGLIAGSASGVGAYTFVYAKGASYMTDDPRACANCHVMEDQYSAWLKSGHRHVAVCNDCHTPKPLLSKYTVKALNGWHHSKAFTTGNFHEPIQITGRNLRVTEEACRRCHEDVVHSIDLNHDDPSQAMSCVRCHSTVGHQ
ncbi:MAG: hypothetical protein AMXMBFR84_19600 [Candidatus Hydrogenedentota bacterium]